MVIATDEAETNGSNRVPVKLQTSLSTPDLDERQGLLVPAGEWAPAGADPRPGDHPRPPPHRRPPSALTVQLCALQASPPDVRGHSALPQGVTQGTPCHAHSALLEEEALRRPRPQEWQRGPGVCKDFLRSKEMERWLVYWCRGCPAAMPDCLPSTRSGPSPPTRDRNQSTS